MEKQNNATCRFTLAASWPRGWQLRICLLSNATHYARSHVLDHSHHRVRTSFSLQYSPQSIRIPQVTASAVSWQESSLQQKEEHRSLCWAHQPRPHRLSIFLKILLKAQSQSRYRSAAPFKNFKHLLLSSSHLHFAVLHYSATQQLKVTLSLQSTYLPSLDDFKAVKQARNHVHQRNWSHRWRWRRWLGPSGLDLCHFFLDLYQHFPHSLSLAYQRLVGAPLVHLRNLLRNDLLILFTTLPPICLSSAGHSGNMEHTSAYWDLSKHFYESLLDYLE